jgi:thiamine-phosphate pyrophosphorylase
MPVEYTPAVTRALEAAAHRAQRQGAAAVEPVHLLRELLREEEARPWLLLVAAGVDPSGLRTAFPADLPAVPQEAAAATLPLGSRAAAALAHARGLARETSADGTVASELVLLALLREDGELRGSLESLGMDLGRLEGEVRARQGPPLQLDEPLDLGGEWTEQVDAARMLDAAANRAREALRVLEDFCRFALDDALLSGELKGLRHDLTAALASLPGELLLAARDTLGDVGTRLSTAGERERHSLADVVQANCKRLQESLRTLEELGKLRDPALGEKLEQMRYQAYTLERALLLGAEARERLAGARLYVLLTGAACRLGLERTLRAALAGGAQVVQLREKDLADRALLERARLVRQWTRSAGALFIMNDRPDIARLAEADGVHLGQDELSVRDARRILGPRALVGVSTHNLEQVRQAVFDGASYVGVGPTFPSATKEFTTIAGLDFVRQTMAATSLPAFAIGGITVANLEQVVAAGARRVAVSQSVCQAEAPEAAAAALRQILDQTLPP